MRDDAAIGILCAMPMELRPLRRPLGLSRQGAGWSGALGGRPVVAVVSGMGTALAEAATEALLDRAYVERVVVVGIAGAVDEETPIGTLLQPEDVVDGRTGAAHRPHPLPGLDRGAGSLWTSDELLTDPAVLADLRGRGVVALDMETAAVAAVCERRGVPWSVSRAISDRATDGSVDPAVLAMSNQDGTPNPRAIARYVLANPTRLAGMARLGRQSSLAARVAATAAVAALSA